MFGVAEFKEQIEKLGCKVVEESSMEQMASIDVVAMIVDFNEGNPPVLYYADYITEGVLKEIFLRALQDIIDGVLSTEPFLESQGIKLLSCYKSKIAN